MEYEIPGAGCCNNYGQFFACSNTKIENFSLSQNPIVKSEALPICFCCLASEAPLVNAERCNHTEFVKIYFQREISSKLWICCLCHYMLVKIEAFRLQINKCFENRYSKIEQPNKWTLINKFSLKTKVTFISLGDNDKPMDIGYEDPLFTDFKIENQEFKTGYDDLFELDEKSVKTYKVTFEPKIDLDSDSSLNASTSTYFNISTNKQTDKLTKSKANKGRKPIETISKRITRSKKNIIEDNQEAVVTPVRKVITKRKTKKSVKKITKTPKKVKLKTAKLKTQDEDTALVINQNQYKGKIQTIELTREELERERQSEREKESWKKQKYKCESCLKGFEYSYVLETHNERHHKIIDSKTMMTCDICKCILSNSSSFRPHYKRHFTRYVCMVCKTVWDDLPKVALHYNTTHADIDSKQMEYKCSDCNFTTYTRRIYNYHKRRLHEAKLCTICNKEFTGGISYNFHMKLCHSDPTTQATPQVYKCNSCPRVYNKKSSCNAHMRVAHGAPPAMLPYCATCDKHFKHISSYRYHLKTTLVHNNGINKSSDGILKLSSNKHTISRLTTRPLFRSSIMCEAGIEPATFMYCPFPSYVCDYCGREFRYKPPLRDHIEIQHLKIWNYRCEPCNKTFSSKNLQMKHIQYVHENKKIPKNKICQFCGKGFASRKTLQCHIRRHTGERPLECEFCGDTFAHDAALYTHRKLKHKVPRKRDKKQPDNGQNTLQKNKNSVGEGQNMLQSEKNSVGGLNMFQSDKNSVGEGQNMFQKEKSSVAEGQNMFQKDKKQLVNSVEQTQLMFQAQMYNMYSNK